MVRQAQAGGQTQADKARAFDQVNAWLDENPEAKTLWDAERGAGRGNRRHSARRRGYAPG